MASAARSQAKSTRPRAARLSEARSGSPAGASDPAPAAPAVDVLRTDEPKPEKKFERFGINLNPDGSLSDRMHPDTRAKLAALVSDPRTAEILGTSKPVTVPADPAAPTVPAFLIPVAVQALNQITIVLAAKTVNLAPDRIIDIARYSDEETEQIAGPLATVLNKYGGKWVSRWGPELALVTAFGMITYQKIAALQIIAEKESPKDARAGRPEPSPLRIVPAAEPQAAAEPGTV